MSAEPQDRALGRPVLAAVLVAGLVLSGCATARPSEPPPSTLGTAATSVVTAPATVASPSVATPAGTSQPSAPASPRAHDFSGLPTLIVARTGPPGTTLWLTAPGDPNARIPLVGPAGRWRADAASADGQRVAFTASAGPSAVVTARLDGTALIAGARRILPVGLLGDDPRAGFVACLSATGDLMVADDAIVLHLVTATGQIGATVPAATLGSCAWSGQESVFFDVEGSHHLGLWQLRATKVAMSDLALTLPAVAGTTVAALSNDDLAGRAVVLSVAGATAGGALKPAVVATLQPAEGEAYAGLRLSVDGRWLVAWGGPQGDYSAWLDVYRLTASGYTLVGRTAFRSDEDVRALVSAP